MSATIVLQPKLDLRAAGPLRDELLARRGGDAVLDASAVTHLGALTLQVIRSAARSWAEAGLTLTLDAGTVSPELADQLALFGFTPDTLTLWEAGA